MAIQAPEGTRDLLPNEAAYWKTFQQIAADEFGKYGYLSIDTPIMELTELFVRGIGEATDVVSKEMFTAISGENLKKLLEGGTLKNKSRLSLRPEGTAGVVRAVVQHDLVPQGAPPVKLMYAGPMFRAERPQRGRQRQFMQIGIECIGADDPTIDAEGIIMLIRFFTRIGIPADSMSLLINSMGCDVCRPAYRDLVKSFMEEHIDEFCDTCKVRMEKNPLRAFDCKGEACAAIMKEAPVITDHLCPDCAEHYRHVKELLDQVGIAYREDPSLVRGLDYYTRTVFEVQAGAERAQSAIGGGGRYDKLSEEVGGRSMPGFGFALGYDRCVLELKEQGIEFEDVRVCDVFAAQISDNLRSATFALVQKLRDAGLVCEMDHQNRSLKSQFKLADKLHAKCVVILGPDELSQGMVKLRDMATHEESLVSLDRVASAISGIII